MAQVTCPNCRHPVREHSMGGHYCMVDGCECESVKPKAEPQAFTPLLCRLRLHRWRVPFNMTIRKGTCRCSRCGRLKGCGAK